MNEEKKGKKIMAINEERMRAIFQLKKLKTS